MGSFLEKIAKRIANAKGGHSAVVDGLTMTGDTPNAVVINPDIQMRTEGFKSFLDRGELLNEKQNMEGNIGSEKKGIRHLTNYVLPYMSDENRQQVARKFTQHISSGKIKSGNGSNYNPDQNTNTHTLASDTNGHKAGTPVRVIGARHDNEGKIFVQTAMHGEVQMSKLNKPEELKKPNITQGGFTVEDKLAKNLGGTAAGSTGTAHDFSYRGEEGGIRGKARKIETDQPYLRGEAKQNKANMGVSSLKFDKDKKKWDFTNEHLRDTFAKATHPDSGLPVLEHLNKFHSNGVIPNGFTASAAPGTVRSYLRGINANSLHLHRTESAGKRKEAIDHGTTYSIGDDNTFKGKTKMSHLANEDLDKLDGKLTVESTTTGSTRAAHKPSFKHFKEYADNSVTNPDQHVDLTREDHAKEVRTRLDDHIAGRITAAKASRNTPSPAPAASENKPAASSSEPERHHTLFWGRANPPHAGHEKAYNVVKKVARQNGGTSSIVLSRTHDNKKNPLTPEQKEKHAKRAFPDVNTSVADPEHNGLLQQLSKLHEQGVTHLHMVAGSDQHKKYSDLINRYNGVKGAHGYYNFKNVTMHSAGERDPDSEGTAGVSATTQRMHASAGRNKEFAKNAPSTMKPGHVKELYNDVRSGMSGPSATAKKIIKRAK
jgi:hypothetical protein